MNNSSIPQLVHKNGEEWKEGLEIKDSRKQAIKARTLSPLFSKSSVDLKNKNGLA